jgi:tRNA (cytidine/uridine-2'-O-)-methyltransferase
VFHVVLYQPEIPPNTGNVIRLCANAGAHLHLVGPLGFSLQDRYLRRAGLDYHELTRVHEYADWEEFVGEHAALPLWAFSTRGQCCYADTRFRVGDALLFGPETKGLPAALLESLGKDRVLRLPMQSGSRSMNLSNAVAIGLYEALRQLDFSGLG